MVPIPVANYFTWKSNLNSEEYVAGVYITASHNPAEYNGIRFRHPDGTGFTEGNVEIKRIFFEEKLIEYDNGTISDLSSEEVLEDYMRFVSTKVGNLNFPDFPPLILHKFAVDSVHVSSTLSSLKFDEIPSL